MGADPEKSTLVWVASGAMCCTPMHADHTDLCLTRVEEMTGLPIHHHPLAQLSLSVLSRQHPQACASA